MESLVYENAVQALLISIPELARAYEQEAESWVDGVPGAYIVYEDLLGPYIDQALIRKDDAALNKIFTFVESLSVASDSRLRDLVTVAICGRLLNDPNRATQAAGCMGPGTRALCRKAKS